MEIDDLVQQATDRLRAAGVRLSIIRRNRQLCLRGTFPAKDGTGEKQQTLSIGIEATAIGVRLAEAKAHQVFLDLQIGRFSWADYYRAKAECKTVGEWAAIARKQYFERRGDNVQVQATWQDTYWRYYRQIGFDKPLTLRLVQDFLDSKKKTRNALGKGLICVGYLCKIAGLEFNPEPWKGYLKRWQVKPRELPTDEEIVEMVTGIKRLPSASKDTAAQWRWVVGAIATYGLRPHEAWFLDLNTLRESQGKKVWLKEGKTGSRWVYPCPVGWVDLFGLLDGEPPVLKCKLHTDYGKRACLWASRRGLPALYNLRHAYAVRLIRYHAQLSTTMAARMMGHSLAVHTQTYQRWLSEAELDRYAMGLD